MIDYFRGENKFLSNFYPAMITYDGIEYKTVENAYQALKTLDMDLRQKISKMTPSEAKVEGNRIKLRTDWDKIKVKIMYELVKQKFSNDHMLQWKLLQAKDDMIIEGNTWHDNFWGNCFCNSCRYIEGLNYLGRILMQVRKELAV